MNKHDTVNVVIIPPLVVAAGKPSPRRAANSKRRDNNYVTQMGEPKDVDAGATFLFSMRAPSGAFFDGLSAREVERLLCMGWELL